MAALIHMNALIYWKGALVSVQAMKVSAFSDWPADALAAADIVRSPDNLPVIESAVFRCVVIH